jgi:ATP adenylyltransferase
VILLEPGSLWARADACAAAALRAGALQPIASEPEAVEEAGVRFLVRVLPELARKERAGEAQRAAGANPFLPYDPALFVAEVSDAHVCLLNKFPVLSRHLLLVTRRFEDQASWLGPADFEALAACLAEAPAFAFYNAGPAAGASQPHKHLQLVPAPLGPGPEAFPLEPRVVAGRLPFPAIAARVDALDPAALHDAYRAALRGLGLEADAAPRGPYNLLATREWLVAVPRRCERFEGISVNALGFAGSLVVRSPAALERLRAVGPLALLRAVAGSAGAG